MVFSFLLSHHGKKRKKRKKEVFFFFLLPSVENQKGRKEFYMFPFLVMSKQGRRTQKKKKVFSFFFSPHWCRKSRKEGAKGGVLSISLLGDAETREKKVRFLSLFLFFFLLSSLSVSRFWQKWWRRGRTDSLGCTEKCENQPWKDMLAVAAPGFFSREVNTVLS